MEIDGIRDDVVSKIELTKMMAAMVSLQNEVKELKQANDKTFTLQQQIYDQMKNMNANTVSDDNKVDIEEEMENSNKQLVLDKKWREWAYVEIVDYIVHLDDGKYSKYTKVLLEKMKLREMEGTNLELLEKSDLSEFFGINNFGDICNLYDEIQTLIMTSPQ